jgi:CRP/FNR family transcriptional regulator, cyclic AMP receptor protein
MSEFTVTPHWWDFMAQGQSPFANLDEAALRALAPAGTVRSYPKGAVLVNVGDTTDALYILLSGRVKAFVSDEDGTEVVLSSMGSGEYFGEIVLDGGARSASVMALEPCRVFLIPHAAVEGLLEQNPAFARDLVLKLIGKVRSLTNKVQDLALLDVYGRFARLIDEHAVEQDGVRVVPERMTQQDMAARIGASREMISRIVKQLVAGGYISIDAKHIVVHKKLPAKW